MQKNHESDVCMVKKIVLYTFLMFTMFATVSHSAYAAENLYFSKYSEKGDGFHEKRDVGANPIRD